MLKKYKVILFDAGGTLLHPYPSVGDIYRKVALKYGCDVTVDVLNERFKKVWHKHDGLTELVSHSDEKVEKHWWHGIVSEVFEGIEGMTHFEDFFSDLFHYFAEPDCWRLYPETIEVLEAIKKSGRRMVIISNWDSRLTRLCEHFNLLPYFEFLLISAVFGVSKPNRLIFDEALKRLEVEPRDAVHIGDSFADDVRGALSANISAIHLNRHGRNMDSSQKGHIPQSVQSIKTLQELLTF